MHMPFALAILILGIHPKVIIKDAQKNIGITKSWKQTKCAKIGWCLNKLP